MWNYSIDIFFAYIKVLLEYTYTFRTGRLAVATRVSWRRIKHVAPKALDSVQQFACIINDVDHCHTTASAGVGRFRPSYRRRPTISRPACGQLFDVAKRLDKDYFSCHVPGPIQMDLYLFRIGWLITTI